MDSNASEIVELSLQDFSAIAGGSLDFSVLTFVYRPQNAAN